MSRESILVVDDEPDLLQYLAIRLQVQGYRVATAHEATLALAKARDDSPDAIVTDFRLSGMSGLELLRKARDLNPEIPVIIMTGYGSFRDAVDAIKEGAFDYLTKPIDIEELDLILQRALERRNLLAENRQLKRQLERRYRLGGIISVSPIMEESLNLAARVAHSEATVLLRGESGTGKELVARAIHAASPRCEGPFIPVNCAALNANLIESELFGHEEGAFTGASKQRIGRFEQANQGSLFIDEVAEIPVEAQVKLLRILQERTLERVGGDRGIPIDVRIIAAASRNLEAMISEGRFREELFYRLNVVPIYLPPLRERRMDIPPLAHFFLTRYAKKNQKAIAGITREAMDLLVKHEYPGNVRELENLIERAVVVARGDTLIPDDLPASLQLGPTSANPPDGPLLARVQAMETAAIRNALKETGGNQTRAASLLGLSERTLRYKMRKYGVKLADSPILSNAR